LVLATLLAGIGAGVVFSHVLQQGPKQRLSGPVFLQVQNTLYDRYAKIVGTIEILVLLLLLIALFTLPTDGVAIWLVGAAAISMAVMVGIWVAWIRPLNIEIRRWTPELMPTDWALYRDRWAMLHLMRMLAALLALTLLLLAVTAHSAY
jgi:hypothetical protein